MLDFRSGQSRPKYLERSNLRKLSWILFAVGMFFIGGRHLYRMSTERIPIAPARSRDETILAQQSEMQFIPGSFRAPAARAQADLPNEGGPNEGGPDADDHRRKLFPGVDAALMGDLRDDQLFRREESAAFYHLLGLLQEATDEQLQERSLGVISYAQLFRQPQVYRGKAVEVRGTVRRVKRFIAPKNDAGIVGYFQLALAPDDEQTSPIFVYCLELPEGFPAPQSEEEVNVREHATLVGLFYRRWGYPSRDDRGMEVLRSAPLVMARSIAWQPPAPAPRGPDLNAMIKLLAGAVAVALVVMFLARRFVLGGTTPRPKEQEPRVSSALDDLPARPTLGETFRALEGAPTVRAPEKRDPDRPPDQRSGTEREP